MKLKVPALYSQRFSSWSPQILGYNAPNTPYTIGLYGCLITSFGMYINQTPDVVNKTLQDNNGFAPASGNFIWSKCTVLGLNQVYQSPFYSDPVTTQGLIKMRALLDEGRPLVTHIDFDPKNVDDDQHWLLVMGYDDNDVFFAYDPWSGTQITLDVYGGVKRCVYEWRAYDRILPKDTLVEQVCMPKEQADDFDRVKDGWNQVRTKLNVEDNVTVVLSEIDKLIGYEDALVQKDKQLTDALTEVNMLRGQLNDLVNSNVTLGDDIAEFKTKLISMEAENVKSKSLYEQAMQHITDLETAIVAPIYKGWKKKLISFVYFVVKP